MAAGFRGFLAFWLGGAANDAVTPAPVVVITSGGSGDNSKSRRKRREQRWLKDREIAARRREHDAPQRIAAKNRPVVARPHEIPVLPGLDREAAQPGPLAAPASYPGRVATQVPDALDRAALERLGQMGAPLPAALMPAPEEDADTLILLMADA